VAQETSTDTISFAILALGPVAIAGLVAALIYYFTKVRH
jgi:hypothetical protein